MPQTRFRENREKNKLVTLCSHDNFQFELHLISHFFFIQLTPKILRGNLPSETVEELILGNFQVIEFYCEFLYQQAVHTGFSLGFPRRRGKHTYISVQGCCFFCKEVTLSAFKV